MPNFRTIRQVAGLGLLSEHQLRLRVAQKRCPGIYCGSRFLINLEALMEQLDTESRKCMGVTSNEE